MDVPAATRTCARILIPAAVCVTCRVHDFRHLAREAAQYDFSLPMPRFCGGALLVTAATFAAVNGYSNGYWGWGGEDDDFCLRLMQKVHCQSRWYCCVSAIAL